METRVRLLIRKVLFFGFTWNDLENYLSKKKSTLIEELNEFFKECPDSDKRVAKIIEMTDMNERRQRRMANMDFAR